VRADNARSIDNIVLLLCAVQLVSSQSMVVNNLARSANVRCINQLQQCLILPLFNLQSSICPCATEWGREGERGRDLPATLCWRTDKNYR